MLKEFIKTTEDARRALLGTILADGHLAQERPTAYHNRTYAEITHTSKSIDLLKAVQELFEIVGCQCVIREHNKKTDNKTYTLFRLSTNCCEELAKLREQIYVNKVKIFPKEIIDCFTPLSLLLLYLDDGTLRVRFKEGTSIIRDARATICLDAFTISEVEYFRTYLKNIYNLDTHIYRHSKNTHIGRGFRIWMNTENTKKFMKVLDKYYEAIPSMQYKFLKYYSL